jgi:hypothetical protein
MEQIFSDQIPNHKPLPDGNWPNSSKHKAPRYEVPAGTDQVQVSFDMQLGERPGPGRVYLIGLMSGPLGAALPVGSLAVGAEDQWLVTADGGPGGKKDIQEDGDKRVLAVWNQPYKIILDWTKGITLYKIFDSTGAKLIHSIVVKSTLNLDFGGRILIGQDVKNPKKLKGLFSLPPFGSSFSGFIKASDLDIDEPDDNVDTPIEPRPVDPLPPPFPPIFTPPISPSTNQPPVIKPSSPVTNSSSFNLDAFPEFVQAAIKLSPELGRFASQILPYIQAITAGKKLADGNFNLSNPNDLIAVLQLINLFQNLK